MLKPSRDVPEAETALIAMAEPSPVVPELTAKDLLTASYLT